MSLLSKLLNVLMIVFFLHGCSNDYIEGKDSRASLGLYIAPTIYRNNVKGMERDGSDEQGPSISHAITQCESNFGREPLSTKFDKISACKYMMTAKYFENSTLSFTFKGTTIYFSDATGLNGNSSRSTHEPIGTSSRLRHIEAIWGKNGALCLSNPRWREIYDRYKPTSLSIRNCDTDPGTPNTPWIGAPFVGGGLLISYYYNQPVKLVTASVGTQYITAPESFIITLTSSFSSSSEFLVFSEQERPLRCLKDLKKECKDNSLWPLDIGGISELEEDTDTAMLSVWECCYGRNCSNITTSVDLTKTEHKAPRGLTAQYNCSIQKQNIGYVYLSEKPETSAIITSQQRHSKKFITAISGFASTEPLDFNFIEGYAYKFRINDISMPPPKPINCCPKFCGESLPIECNFWPPKHFICLECKSGGVRY